MSEYKCSKCQKCYSSISSLNYHLKTKCNDNIVYLHCVYCSYSTPRKDRLDEHLQNCKSNGKVNSIKEETNKNLILKDQELENLKQVNTEKDKRILELEEKCNEYEKKMHISPVIIMRNERDIFKNKCDELEKTIKLLEKDKNNYLTKIDEHSETIIKLQNMSTKYLKLLTDNNISIKDEIIKGIKKFSLKHLIIESLDDIDNILNFDSKEISSAMCIKGFNGIYDIIKSKIQNLIIITDESRMTLNYKYQNKIIKDPKGIEFIKIIGNKISNIYNSYDKQVNFEKTNNSIKTSVSWNNELTRFNYASFCQLRRCINNNSFKKDIILIIKKFRPCFILKDSFVDSALSKISSKEGHLIIPQYYIEDEDV